MLWLLSIKSEVEKSMCVGVRLHLWPLKNTDVDYSCRKNAFAVLVIYVDFFLILFVQFASIKSLTCSFKTVIIHWAIQSRGFNLCVAEVQTLSNSTWVTLLFVFKVSVGFALQHFLHFHWIYFKLECSSGKIPVVSTICWHEGVRESINICISETDGVLVWLRPWNDFICMISEVQPVENHTVTLLEQGCYRRQY